MLGTLKNRSTVVYLLLLFVSAVSSYLLVILGYFPYLGVGVFFMLLSSLVFVFKKEKSVNLWLLYGLTLSFSLFIFYRANPFLVFLNMIAVVYFGSMLALRNNEERNIYGYLGLPLDILSKSIKSRSAYGLDLTGRMNQDQFSLKRFSGIIISVFITIVILLMIVPLLSYSNPFFGKLVTDFFDIVSFQRVIEFLFGENLFIYLTRALVFLVLALVVPRLLTYMNTHSEKLSSIGLSVPIYNLLIPKVVTGVVLAIFFVTQAQLYLASEETLKSLEYTHSQYAREVFAQLSIVTLIIFSLIYSDRIRNRWSKLLTYLLIVEALFLNLIAIKSDYDYSFNWGFTHNRLYGYAVAIWICGLFLLFLYHYRQNLKNSKFVNSIVLWSGFILLAINIINFDYVIYHYAKSTTHAGIDHYYLSRLSTDAHSYREHLQQLIADIENNDKEDYGKVQSAWGLINNINKLKYKYEKLDVRTLNISEYLEYLRIKDLNLEPLKNVLLSKPIFSPASLVAPMGYEYQNGNEPLNLPTPMPAYVRARLVNLDKRLYNHNFEIRNTEDNITILRASLDGDSFDHTHGIGKYSVVVYDYVTEGDTIKEIPEKELFYTIGEGELNKDIHYN